MFILRFVAKQRFSLTMVMDIFKNKLTTCALWKKALLILESASEIGTSSCPYREVS